jgi:polygalacturonase
MRKIKFCGTIPKSIQRAVITVGVLLATVALGAPALPNINTNNVVNITTYGATNNGTTDNTAAIQSAINTAAAGPATNGLSGGTVRIPAPGVFLSGPLALKSKVNLQIDSGATLKFLPFSSYPNASGTPAYPLAATNLTDLEISGAGTIDGNGAGWWSADPPNRPYLIYFSKCYRVLIQNITLQNPPKMHIVFKNSAGNITVQGITINTTAANAANTDGIDLIGTNCLVQDCSISAGDDNIALGSSGSSAVSSDTVITNCSFGVGHGVSIGGNTAGGVSNLTVINCSFNNTDYGIRMKSDNATGSSGGAGGVAQNLSYLNIGMTNITRGAIVIYSYYNGYGTPTAITPAIASTQSVDSLNIPIWRNITISNVTALVTSNGSTPGIAGIIWGRIETPVTNLTLSHVSITAPKSFDVYNAYGIRFVDFTNTLPSGNKTFTLYNTDVTITNSTPGANPITFDGLTSDNSLALHQAPASMTAGDAFGANPITLDASTLTISNAVTLPGSTVVNFTLSTNSAKVVATGNLTLNSTLNIAAGDGFSAGTYTLFIFSGSLGGTPTLGGTPAGYNCSLTNPPGQLQLLVQSPLPPSPPSFGRISVTSNGLVMSGTGGTTNGTFYVLVSTNVALPLNQWQPIATNLFDGNGPFIFTNTISTNGSQAFYLLAVP